MKSPSTGGDCRSPLPTNTEAATNSYLGTYLRPVPSARFISSTICSWIGQPDWRRHLGTMPTYRSITLTLHSQFDIETLPEYLPRPQAYYTERDIVGNVPPLIDEKASICSVYVPALPGSQFWIGYSVSPPVPEDQQFLFKLFINGTHIVSWSTGKEERWRGKTMFGLYEREDESGKRRTEKRVLCFTSPDKKDGQWKDVPDAFDEESYMELRVHRAHARKRIERKIEDFKKTEHAKSRRGVE